MLDKQLTVKSGGLLTLAILYAYHTGMLPGPFAGAKTVKG